MDLQQAQRQLIADLSPLYDDREARLIADWVLERVTGLTRLDRLVRASDSLSADAILQYNGYRDELRSHRPIQYVLHESWFAGLQFYVDENVLIPRPETEELVEWIAESRPPGPVLDVGTGSGCIAITLAKKLPSVTVHACDISRGALEVAKRNAANLNALVTFHHLDFLDPSAWTALPPIQCLVSNPPYIPLSQRAAMARHVTDAEPAVALFVPDADPLLFYRALAEFARQHLLPDGGIFVEIHEDLAAAVLDVFGSAGFQQLTLRKDLQGRDRMINASQNSI